MGFTEESLKYSKFMKNKIYEIWSIVAPAALLFIVVVKNEYRYFKTRYGICDDHKRAQFVSGRGNAGKKRHLSKSNYLRYQK